MTSYRRVLLCLPLVLMTIGCNSSNNTTTPTTPTTPTAPTPTNHAPVLGAISVSPTFGVSGLTLITMIAAASDADGDPLTYTWSFGGATATGASASAKLTGDGPVAVQVTVSDGKGETATDSRTVTIGTMTGNWSFVIPGDCGTDPREAPAVFTLTQTGGTVTGSLAFPGHFCNVNPGTHSEIPASTPGSIDDQGNFNLPRVAAGSFVDVRLANGKMDSTGRKIIGQMFNSGFNGEQFILTKQ
jgi:hypothetical protein